jgi:lipoprotein NlpI
MKRFLLFTLLVPSLSLCAQDLAPEARKALLENLAQQKAQWDAALKKDSTDADALTRRGDVYLFLGDAKAAVADFEKEIEIEPSRDSAHWRLGIAYHFAGDMTKSAAQFAKYHAYDDRDRENGIWHFLANAQVKGLQAARQEMLEYTQFDREPFPSLYDMFAGKRTGAEVLEEMKTKSLADNPLVMFFAHYYVGLNEQLLGQHESALTQLAKAVQLAGQARAGGGPGYMGQVARLHYEAAVAKAKSGAATK